MLRQVLKCFLNGCCAVLFCSFQLYAIAMPPRTDAVPSSLVYFATNSSGIYAYRFTSDSDQLELIGLVAEINQATWLTLSPSHKFLYAVSESDQSHQSDGAIVSYSLDARTGKLTLLNKVSGGGKGTTYVTLDKTEKVLLANNFSGGQVMAFLLNDDGSIGQRTAFIQHTGSGVVPSLQASAHPHEEVVASDNRHVIVPDLGADKVYTYLLDPARGTLEPGTPPFITVPAGYGPRHFAFHPNGRFGYLIDELQSAVTVFAYTSATGGLKPLQTISTLPDSYTGPKSASELWVDKAGRFLYAASRADNAIVVFSIDPRQGTLTLVQRISTQGKWPRGFALDLTERYLFVANERSDSVTVFKIDPSSGKLSPTGQMLNIPQPASVLFVPAEKP